MGCPPKGSVLLHSCRRYCVCDSLARLTCPQVDPGSAQNIFRGEWMTLAQGVADPKGTSGLAQDLAGAGNISTPCTLNCFRPRVVSGAGSGWQSTAGRVCIGRVTGGVHF